MSHLCYIYSIICLFCDGSHDLGGLRYIHVAMHPSIRYPMITSRLSSNVYDMIPHPLVPSRRRGSRKQITLFGAIILWVGRVRSRVLINLLEPSLYCPLLILHISTMRLSATTLLAILPFLGSALASDVLDLTESNFKSEVLGQDLALVE